MEEKKKKQNNEEVVKENKSAMTTKSKVLIAIIAIVIIAGIIVTLTVGLNFDLRYRDSKRVELYLQTDFNISDIKQITDEVMPGEQVIIQKVEVYEDTVSITVKDITDEQKQSLIDKVNEKYGTELSSDSVEVESVPNTRGRDIIKPYIAPFIIATLIILVYMAVRYRKMGVVKTLLKTVIISVVAQSVLLSIMAITRIPIGIVTIPLVITVYLLTLIGLTAYFEKQLTNKNKEETKKYLYQKM